MEESQNIPEAYRLGDVPFLGLTIYLDSHPLIPRVETEWWVERLIAHMHDPASLRSSSARSDTVPTRLREAQYRRVLDLCAGSGAIGCALLKHVPGSKVYFGEIDLAHEATIRKNIAANGLDVARADIRIGDLFAPFPDMRFDVIAANPPYVPEGRTLEASVEDYEPALALRAGPDGLAVIRRIASEIGRHLAPGGVAWVECDSEHAEAARALFLAAGLSCDIRRDQYDRPRILVVSSTSSPA